VIEVLNKGAGDWWLVGDQLLGLVSLWWALGAWLLKDDPST
jgi:hypothetical protein